MHVVCVVDLCRQAEVGFVSGNSGKQSLFSCLWILYVVLLQAGNGGRIGTGAGCSWPFQLSLSQSALSQQVGFVAQCLL